MSALVAKTHPSLDSRETLHGYALYLGDTSLILAQRLGEWVGRAPALEEELALANVALDLLGQARYLLSYAGQIEGKNRTEDELAFLREPEEFTNLNLVEQPNGDFAFTIVRQFLLDAWQLELFDRLQHSSEPKLAELAAKALKETRYHFRFSSGWLVRLGDGTEESHRRAQDALDALWRFTHEFWTPSAIEREAIAAGIAPDPSELYPSWSTHIDSTLAEVTLRRPADVVYRWHGKCGRHSEHLSRLLAEMQYLQRSFPGAQW